MSREEYLLNIIQVLNPVVIQGTVPDNESVSIEKAEFLYETVIMDIYSMLYGEFEETTLEQEKVSEEACEKEADNVEELYHKQKKAEQALMYEEAISLLQKRLENLD